MAGQDVPPLYTSANNRDGDFDDATADPAVVAEAWAAWRAEVEFSTKFVAEAASLDITANDAENKHGSGGDLTSLREILARTAVPGCRTRLCRHRGPAD